MNSIAKYVVIFIVAMALGYKLYPQLNNNSAKPIQPIPAQLELVPESPADKIYTVATDSVTKRLPIKATTNSDDVSFTNRQNDQNDSNIKNEPLIDIQEPQRFSQLNRDAQATISQQELVDWQIQHNEQLKRTLEQQLPINILDGMLKQIYTDNAFLDEIIELQNPTTDQDWAYSAEQQIRDQIQMHQNGTSVELFSVICKQLTCEVKGKSHQTGVWQPIYISVLSYFAKNAIQLNSEAAKNITFIENDIDYFYSQFVFTKA